MEKTNTAGSAPPSRMPVWFDPETETATFVGFDPDTETATVFPTGLDTRYYARNKDKIIPVNFRIEDGHPVAYEIQDKKTAAVHCLNVIWDYLTDGAGQFDNRALPDNKDVEASAMLMALLKFYKITHAEVVRGWLAAKDGTVLPHAWVSVPGSEFNRPEVPLFYLSATVSRFTGLFPLKYQTHTVVMLSGLHPDVVLKRPGKSESAVTYDELFDRVRKDEYDAPPSDGPEKQAALERAFRADLVNMLKNKYDISEGAAMLICARAAAGTGHPRIRSRMAVLLDADSLTQLFMNININMRTADGDAAPKPTCPVCRTELDGTAADFDDAELTEPGVMAAPAKCPRCKTDLVAVYEAGPYELVRFETTHGRQPHACKQAVPKP